MDVLTYALFLFILAQDSVLINAFVLGRNVPTPSKSISMPDNTTSLSAQPSNVTVTIPHSNVNELDLSIVFSSYSTTPLPFDAAQTLLDSAYLAAQSFPHISALVAGGTWRLSYSNILLHVDEIRPATRSTPPFTYQVIRDTVEALYHVFPTGRTGERGNYFGVQFYIYATRGESETGREDVGWGELRGPDGISNPGASDPIVSHNVPVGTS